MQTANGEAEMRDWNDLKLVLAVARAGGLSGAAEALGLNHSTVWRRLAALEERAGARLFERLPGGAHVLTPAGERAAAAAERMETEAAALDRDLTGADLRLTGRLRVTSSETLAYALLTRHVAAFRAKHPGIVVELALDNRVLSLSRREADVALRVARPREPDLYGRKLGDVAWTVYGRRDRADRAPAGADPLQDRAFVGWEEAASGVVAADWLRRRVPEGAVVYRSNSLINQLVAAKAGLGLAVLPCYLGDAEAELERVLPEPAPELERELWIVCHEDLRRTARVRAFLEVVGDGLASERDRLGGQGGRVRAARA
jgi:molybdate transport repressor ModE-like protein